MTLRFKRYKNKDTGEVVKACAKEIRITELNNGERIFHLYWYIEGNSNLIPNEDFIKQYEEALLKKYPNIDGYYIENNDKVLVTGQKDRDKNGIYKYKRKSGKLEKLTNNV